MDGRGHKLEVGSPKDNAVGVGYNLSVTRKVHNDLRTYNSL